MVIESSGNWQWLSSQSHHTGIEIVFYPFEFAGAVALNRTIQELKCEKTSLFLVAGMTLNRTIQELKCSWFVSLNDVGFTLNRTIQELK